MKSIKSVMICISLCLFLVGCKDTNEIKEEVTEMTEEELYDIYYLKEAPEATDNHDLSEVIKIAVVKNEHSQDETIAIDVENDGIYINPSSSSLGIRAAKGMKKIDDMDQVIDILEKYNVQDWKEDYTTEDPASYQDGVGWNVWIQYTDGTVQSSKGSGSGLARITPDGFADFFNELATFVEERLEDDETK